MSRTTLLKIPPRPLISKSDSGRGRNGHDRLGWVPLPHSDSHSGTENARSPPDRAFAYQNARPSPWPGVRLLAISPLPAAAGRRLRRARRSAITASPKTDPRPLPLRIATWNINSLRLRLDNVTRI